MNKKTSILMPLLIIMIILSCKDKQANRFQRQILGVWKQAEAPRKVFTKNIFNSEDVVLLPPLNKIRKGYEFFADHTCESKTGVFKVIPNSRAIRSGLLFLGTKTEYKIEEDSLKVLNPGNGKWNSMKIESITPDTLKLRDNNNESVHYTRVNYSANKRLLFDKVVVSASGCYGTCSVNSTLITSAGDVLYYGEDHNTKEGLYTSKITSSDFKKIEEAFLKANVLALDKDYNSGWTDDESITVSFINRGKIVKTIQDYGHDAPTEFYWAYMPLSYLYQSVKLHSLKNIPSELNIELKGFAYSKKICALAKSEQFYLLSLLRSARRTESTFEKKYKLLFGGKNQVAAIETDGRYYRFIRKDGQQMTFDIGSNFMVDNASILHVRDITEYD